MKLRANGYFRSRFLWLILLVESAPCSNARHPANGNRIVKTLVVCIDGTWNSPGQRDADPTTGRTVETRTNVAATWEILTGEQLDRRRPYGSVAPLCNQPGAALYLTGVGCSRSRAIQLFQGATGRGLAERIRDAYRFLSERWRPGDRIMCFGFSRGAFAARSLAGFIETVGLPKSNNLIKEYDLARLYAMYRHRMHRPCIRPNWTVDAPVQFLGIWDTVGALALGRWPNGYHKISPANVAHVCHAVALDEERRLFWPELWLHKDRPGQKVEEVLFEGAHTNVGGGYSDARLSAISLSWVLDRAKANGLVLDVTGHETPVCDAAFQTSRASYTEFWHKCPMLGPIVTHFGIDRARRPVHAGQQLHPSVIAAIGKGRYQPIACGVDRLTAA